MRILNEQENLKRSKISENPINGNLSNNNEKKINISDVNETVKSEKI